MYICTPSQFYRLSLSTHTLMHTYMHIRTNSYIHTYTHI